VKPLLTALLLAFLIPSAAQAKGVGQVAVCGADACRDAGVAGGEPFDLSRRGVAPAPGPYYELRLSFGHGAQSRGIYYEPRSGLAAYSEEHGSTGWVRLAQPFAAAVKEAAKDVEPLPAPRLTAVYVGDRRVAGDPSTYLKLFGVHGPFVVPAAAGFDWIRFESPDANPWTENALAFYPRNGVLLNGSRYVKLPPALAADIAAARPLDRGQDGGFRIPWIAVGTALAGALVLLGLGVRRTSAREVAPVH